MQQPIFLLYNLKNFYQNHRRYMKSKSADQLSGNIISEQDAIRLCDPIIFNKNLNLPKMVSWDNVTPINPDDIASPCGLIAKSVFNDTYQLFSD